MAVNLSFIGGAGWQFLDNNGVILSGGKIYTYAAGTTTPLETYTARDGITPNTNPIILDSAGRTPQQIWSTEGLLYKYVVATSSDVVLRTWDNIGGSVVASNLAQDLANTTDNTKGDALIGFKQSNSSGFLTGAVARTVNGKLQEFVSVKDFGAVGDGVTDDHAAFQAAVDASDQVYIPAGTYALSLNVELRDNSYIFGDGMGASILVKTAPSAAPLGFITANTDSSTVQFSNITLRDFEMRDSVASLGFSEFLYLVNFSGVNNALIERVKFYGFRGDGLYIGQWTNAAFTRLNTNITVRDCVFDGVNKDNRQGISVITGENILITGCDFRNITRSNMPGAIDFEPNGVSGTEVIRNCRVIGNSFKNIGGNVGAVTFAIPSNVVAANNFVVSNNSFLDTNRMVNVIHTRVTTQSQNVVISGNTGYNVSQPFELLRLVRGVTITNNATFGPGGGVIGFDTTDQMEDIVISGNSFSSDGVSLGGAMVIAGQTESVLITNNTFNGWNDYCVLLTLGAADNISKINISNNNVQNLRGTAFFALQGSGTTDGKTCVYKNNVGASNNAPFWLTDEPGLAVNGTTAVSFNSATLPDTFPGGNCISLINGDTGVPNTGGYQGTLINYKPNTQYTHYAYQLYYPANNTVKLGSFYIRKRAAASNTWTAWYEVIGV
jgi:hypothetical protein